MSFAVQLWTNCTGGLTPHTYDHRENAGDDLRARKPLADARIDVQPVPGKPGWFEAVAYLRPHFQFETITTSLRLVAEVPTRNG